VVAVYTVCMLMLLSCCGGCIYSLYVDATVVLWWLYIQSVCLCYCRAVVAVYTVCMLMVLSCWPGMYYQQLHLKYLCDLARH
jgi:hypothetical protein